MRASWALWVVSLVVAGCSCSESPLRADSGADAGARDAGALADVPAAIDAPADAPFETDAPLEPPDAPIEPPDAPDCDRDDDLHVSLECGGTDCNDDVPTIHRAALETCNDADDDCDGLLDEAAPSRLFYRDEDGDLYGDEAVTMVGCAAIDGYVTRGGDCDDTDSGVHPGASELCNEVDDDCAGGPDDGLPTSTHFVDDDFDGFGDSSRTVEACGPSFGIADVGGDCDDAAGDVFPGAAEVCNLVDDDCDGTADDGLPGFADTFDGATLDTAWVQAIGAAPTFTVTGGVLEITDAAFAVTPSLPANSWIYDYQIDPGNQLQRAAAIGTGDFALETTVSFASDVPQLTLAGVALVTSSGAIEILLGAGDGSATDAGALGASHALAGPGIGGDWSSGLIGAGAATFRVVRLAGEVTLTVDGIARSVRTSTRDLAAVAIVTVRHRAGSSVFEFGTARVESVRLCF